MDACPVCGTERSAPWAELDGFRYVACEGCGLVHLDPVPSASDARRYYDSGYFTGEAPGGYDDYLADERLHRRNARRQLNRIERLAASAPRRLVDVGCAYGLFADEAHRRGWEVAGVDIAAEATRVAHERYGLDVHPTLEAACAGRPGTIGVVTMLQVLEHLGRPVEALATARSCLAPDGLLVVETWDRKSLVARLLGPRWQQVNPPSVVSLFDRDGLARLLGRQGFGSVRIHRTLKLVSLRFVLALVTERYPRTARVLQPVARHAGDLPLPYVLTDLVTITARPGRVGSGDAAQVERVGDDRSIEGSAGPSSVGARGGPG